MTSATLGAFAALTSGSSGSYAASYDALGRLTSESDTYTPSGGASATLYSTAASYDAAGARPRSARMTCAALRPGAPETEPPGCVQPPVM